MLSAVMTAPESVRGTRTTPEAARMFAAIDDAFHEYRGTHPNGRVVSIDDEDGAQSLLLLSFPEDNPHPLPVYWSAPVLATTTYPSYMPALRREMAERHPLLVDHHAPPFFVRHLPGYALQMVAIIGTKDAGYWYIYAPVEHEPPPAPVFLDWEGHRQPLPADEAAQAAFVEQPNPFNRVGGARADARAGGVDVYTIPANLNLERTGKPELVTKLTAAPSSRAAAVTVVSNGAWTVDGHVDSRYGYLLQFPMTRFDKGAVFVARGTVRDGGLSLGLIQADGRWNGVVNVTKPGPFIVALQVPVSGTYSVTLANCVESNWQSTLGRLSERNLENHFSISSAGWLPSP
jgi:hypothetical protein